MQPYPESLLIQMADNEQRVIFDEDSNGNPLKPNCVIHFVLHEDSVYKYMGEFRNTGWKKKLILLRGYSWFSTKEEALAFIRGEAGLIEF